MTVSVIVPVYNGLRFLAYFWQHLEAALQEVVDAEVIIVDDGSTEPVAETVPQGILVHSRMVRHSLNLGFAASVNEALAIASRPILILLNTDVLLEPDALAKTVRHINALSGPAILGAKLVFPQTGRLQHAGMVFSRARKHHFLKHAEANHPLAGHRRRFQAVTFAVAAFPQRVTELVGPFDDVYFNRNEDIDYCLRASQRGVDILYEPDIRGYHWESLSGHPRFALSEENETRFWSRWSPFLRHDLAEVTRENLETSAHGRALLNDRPWRIVNLSRGTAGDEIVNTVKEYAGFPTNRIEVRRQREHTGEQMLLHLALDAEFLHSEQPFVYVVDSIAAVTGNALWFECRQAMVGSELLLDHNGNVVSTGETT